jgi:hypothetical protein
MKSIFSSFLFTLLITNISFAQPIKGTYVIGGGVSINYNKTPTLSYSSERTSFSISPSFGRFVSEKYQLEGGLGYSFQHQTNNINQEYFVSQNIHSFSIKFGITRYFPIADRFFFTLGANIIPAYGVANSNSVLLGVETNNKVSNISGTLNVSPGLTYFINNKWMLYSYIGLMNYEITHYNESEQTEHNFFASISANSFGLGVRYILGNKTNP